MFHAGLSFEDNIDSTVAIHGSDDQTNPSLVTSFEKSKSYTEKVDHLPVLRASSALITELNLLNDLNNDSKANILANGFYEPEFLIYILSKDINKHKQFLNTFSKKNASDLNRQYQGLTKALLEIHNSIELPIALAMQDEPSLKNNPLIIQSLKPIDEKNFSIQFFLRRLINFNSLISTFTGYDVLNPIKQKVVMNISKISQSEWDALPQADKDLLLNNFDYILELFDDLASVVTGAILADITEDALTNKKTINLAKETITKAKSILTTENIEAILEIVYQLSKAGLNIIANRNPDYQANINDINNTTRKNIKELKKRTDYLAVVCETDSGIRSIEGFRTQATGDSNLEKAKCVPVVIEPKNRLTDVASNLGHAKSTGKIAGFYKNNNKKAPFSQIESDETAMGFITKFNKISNDLSSLQGIPPTDLNNPIQTSTGQRKVYEMIKSFLANAKNNGIPINKYITKPKNDSSLELYFPNFSSFVITTVKFSEPPSIPGSLSANTMNGITSRDDVIGRNFSMKSLYDNNIIFNDPASKLNAAKQEMTQLKKKFNLQWHHVEDMDTYQWIPGIFHFGLRHNGAKSIIENIQGTNDNPINTINRDDWQTFIGSPEP